MYLLVRFKIACSERSSKMFSTFNETIEYNCSKVVRIRKSIFVDLGRSAHRLWFSVALLLLALSVYFKERTEYP